MPSAFRVSLNTPADGMRAAVPVVLGYLPIGFAAGIVGTGAGLSPAEVALLSLLVFAGSAQFVFANLLGGGAGLIITIFLVNLRHLLYSIALAQKLKKLPVHIRAAIGIQLTDETFALGSALCRQPAVSGGGLLALNITSYSAWFAGNVAGAVLGTQIPMQNWGADFLLAAMFAALLMLSITATSKKTGAVAVLALAAVLMVGLELAHPHPLNILLAASTAAAAGAAVFGDAGRAQ